MSSGNHEEQSGSKSKGKLECWYYHKKGYLKKDCWDQKVEEEEANVIEENSLIISPRKDEQVVGFGRYFQEDGHGLGFII